MEKYIDKIGNFNSVYPPTTYLTNAYWIYCVPQFKPENILILGYENGTIAGLVRLLYGDVPITGVDNKDCENRYNVNLIKADAREYIKSCPHFEAVIIDITSDVKGEDLFIYESEFAEDIGKIADYIIINAKPESNMHEYRKRFNRFGSNKPNRIANRIYYFGTKDYNHLIIR